jgi:hypothetical protein
LKVVRKLLDKFIFKIPGIDEKGHLCSLYLLQLIDEEDIETAKDFLLKLSERLLNSRPI